MDSTDPRIIHVDFDGRELVEHGNFDTDLCTRIPEGSAVYAYFILANQIPEISTITTTYLTFQIDGEVVGNFAHEPDNTTRYEYNVQGYGNASLAPGQHRLSIVADGPRDSLVMFDYAIYTCVGAFHSHELF